MKTPVTAVSFTFKEDASTQRSDDRSDRKRSKEPASNPVTCEDGGGGTPRVKSQSVKKKQRDKKTKKHKSSLPVEQKTLKSVVSKIPSRIVKSGTGSKESDKPGSVKTTKKKVKEKEREMKSNGGGKTRREELEREAYYLMKQIRDSASKETGSSMTPQQTSPDNSDESRGDRTAIGEMANSKEVSVTPRRREYNGLIDLLRNSGSHSQLSMEMLISVDDDLSFENLSMDSIDAVESESDEIEVIETQESQDVSNMVETSKLSRLGLRRPMWSSKFSSYFVILTFLLGYDTLISFTTTFGKYGISFVTAYFITLILVGFPLMYLELALGQFTSSNVLSIFDNMCPALSGVGVLAIMLNFWTMLTDHQVITTFVQMLFHLGNPFTNEMPWMNCVSSESKPSCRQLYRECSQYTPKYNTKILKVHEKLVDSASKYSFLGDVCVTTQFSAIRPHQAALDEGFLAWFSADSVTQFFLTNYNIATLETFSYPSFGYHIGMLASWFMVLVLVSNSSKYIVWVSKFAVMLMVCSVGLLIVVLIFVRSPDFPYLSAILLQQSFFDVKMWSDALFLTLRSLKLGQGGLIFLGAQNRFHNNLFSDCIVILLIVAIVPYLYSLVHLIVLDSFAMQMAEGSLTIYNNTAQSAAASELFSSGNQAVHMILFTQSLRSYGAYEPFVLFVFTLMCTILILANKVIRVEIILSVLIEQFPVLNTSMGRKTIVGVIVGHSITILFFLAAKRGFNIIISLEVAIFPTMASIAVLMEIILVLFFYGARRLFANITFMISKGHSDGLSVKINQITNTVVLLLWSTVIPISLCVAVLTKLTNGISMDHSGVSQYLMLLAISFIPAIGIMKVSRKWQETGRFPWTLFRVNADLWGPRSSVDRNRAAKAEKGIRNFF